MSTERKMKSIDIEVLDNIGKKVWQQRIKKSIPVMATLIVIAVGVWGGHKLFADETLESKFVVNNMTCGGCIGKVKKACSIPGVIDTEVNLITQTAFIKFNNKQTSPETIKAAINQAGFPSVIEGTVTKTNKGIDKPVLASINGQPLFESDMEIPLWTEKSKAGQNKADRFYDLVAWHVFLDAAISENLFTHPYQVLKETDMTRKKENLTKDQIMNKLAGEYGSFEKYLQVAGCRKSIFKMADKIIPNSSDIKEKKAVLSNWLAERFKNIEVNIYDKKLKETLLATTGESTWPKIWPQIISKETGIHQAIIQ